MTDPVLGTQLAVLGRPITHSLSPAIHSAAYKAIGLDWSYSAIDLGAAELPDFLGSRDNSWIGFSVTMPLKRQAFECSTPRDEFTRLTGVVNTLVRNGRDWNGYNTDVPGAVRVLQQLTGGNVGQVLLLGSGATAASIVIASLTLNAGHIIVCARRAEAFHELNQIAGAEGRMTFLQLPSEQSADRGRARFSDALASADVIVNTLPAEAAETLLANVPAAGKAVLFDVTYDPLPTPLTTLWAQRKSEFRDGRELLIQQAVLQVRLFVNGTVEAELPDEQAVVAAMRHACMGE